MNTASVAIRPSRIGLSGILIVLMAIAIFIHSLDRGNLATAAPLIKDDLKVSNAEFGVLLSAFYWIYVPGQLLSGWLVERINAYRTLALGLAMWSMATFLTGLAPGFATLLALRLLLGLGESAGFPATSKLLALHVPPRRLGSANSFVSAGLMLGNGAGTLLGGLLIAHLGWRPLFLVFGAVSMTWLVPWFVATRALTVIVSGQSTIDEPSFRELLAKRELWGASMGHFAMNYPYFLVLSWLPLYLVKSQGYSLTEMAQLGGIVYVLSAVFGLIGGSIADRWMARGTGSNRVRKSMIIAAGVVSLGCMLACALGGPKVAIAGLLTFSLANGLGSFNLFAIGQTLAGPSAAGKWVGVQNAFGGVAGIVGPILTGFIIDWTGGFRPAFLVAAGIVLMGLLCWGIVIRKIEPVAWTKSPA
jgi:MFS family permease